MRLAIQQVEEVFLQGFATGPGLGREHAAGGFRDAANLESDHEGILPLNVSAMRSSQSGERAVGLIGYVNAFAVVVDDGVALIDSER